jgi:hypothetical protein
MVAEAARQLGGIHILVNSGSAPGGSVSGTGPIENLIDEDLIEDFNIEYVGALAQMTKTLAVQLGRFGITVNCIHPGTTRTERTPSLLADRAARLTVSAEEAERQDFLSDSPRGNAIGRMVDAKEVAFVAAFLASDKAWAVSGALVAASGGAAISVYYWTVPLPHAGGGTSLRPSLPSARPTAPARPRPCTTGRTSASPCRSRASRRPPRTAPRRSA